MFRWFKKPVSKVGFTTETASSGVKTQGDLAKCAVGKADITHDKMNAIASLYLGVTIENCLYKIKHSNIYGVVFGIVGVNFKYTDDKGVVDVVIRLADVGLCSSMTMEISIKDVAEFLEPVKDIVITKKEKAS